MNGPIVKLLNYALTFNLLITARAKNLPSNIHKNLTLKLKKMLNNTALKRRDFYLLEQTSFH
tara:strand:- start:1901 stop:2086 length:186 start_codon:yes stop_codon:yes gene_type:complete